MRPLSVRALRSSAALWLLGLTSIPSPAGAAAGELDGEQAEVVTSLGEEHPHALKLVLEGQVALERRDFVRAEVLFHAAAEEAPNAPLPALKRCQALSELDRHSEAVAACEAARLRGANSPFDLGVMVHARMNGDGPPTPAEVGEAFAIARNATVLGPKQPWGFAALCEIAHKIENRGLFERSLEELERVAPDHPTTRRLRALGTSRTRGVAVAAAWLLVLLASLFSLVHALASRRRPSASA
jgi:hypothetical protein